MPQMSPMWWLTLMLIFNFSFLMMNSVIYFNYKVTNKCSVKMLKYKLNWKW
uniref:ATP synthase complex subunit 8 n=1 Tax=Idiocerus salicis TaxID=2705176 RepID=A0A6C0AAW6_9HEMI|nr:ATP synthase F0 subunit 8 [Idiocerus salicis]QHS71297.1 ATP synthase F0 subunit 8 [Idiocerus salicis]WEP24852.1 ATP synthase F0 subunit 8 [Idiocerus sp.]